MHSLADNATAPAGAHWVGRIAYALTAVVAGSLLLAASARIQVPFWPVPMTMQTLAVIVIGMVLGSRLGCVVVTAYALEGLVGLPVFANAPERGAGLAYLIGPTGGYIVGFCMAAYVSGRLAENGFADSLLRASVANLVGTMIIVGCGVLWLAHLIGASKAVALGMSPFLLPSLVKVVLGGVLVTLISRTPLRQLRNKP